MAIEAKKLSVIIKAEFDLGFVEGRDAYTKAIDQTVSPIEALGAKIKSVKIKEQDYVEGGG